jgi:hypothetical protein
VSEEGEGGHSPSLSHSSHLTPHNISKVHQKLNLILIKMKRINLKAAIETFAAQQAKIVDAEAPYAEYDPYANID